jgi:hypothetical protein
MDILSTWAVVWTATSFRDLTGKFDLGAASLLTPCGQSKGKKGPSGAFSGGPLASKSSHRVGIEFRAENKFRGLGHSVT